jgi:Beta-propeller domains of methanol dehydrogenase type
MGWKESCPISSLVALFEIKSHRHFKQAQYAQGIDAGLTEITRILNQDPEVAAQAAQELKERQEQALHEQQAKEKTFTTVLIILVIGIFASLLWVSA